DAKRGGAPAAETKSRWFFWKQQATDQIADNTTSEVMAQVQGRASDVKDGAQTFGRKLAENEPQSKVTEWAAQPGAMLAFTGESEVKQLADLDGAAPSANRGMKIYTGVN